MTRVRAGEDLHIGLGIENISLGGLFVRCNIPLKVGRQVTLELLRPGASQPLAIEGRITSAVTLAQAAEQNRSAGMGIAFAPLPPHLQQRLEGLIGAIDPAAMKPALPEAQVVLPRAVKGKAPASTDRTTIVAAFAPQSNDQLQRQIEALKLELQDRNKKIEELLKENKQLWQRVRMTEG